MDIKDILNSSDKLKTQFEYKGISLTVAYITRAKSRSIGRAATAHPYNKGKDKREAEMQLETFLKTFLAEAVIGWEKVTPRKLRTIVPIKSDLTEEQLDTEIPFSTSALSMIVEQAYELEEALQEFCTNLDNFQPGHVEAVKNSETSPTGS